MQKLGFMQQSEESYWKSLQLDPNHMLTKFRLAALLSKVKSSSREHLLEAEQL